MRQRPIESKLRQVRTARGWSLEGAARALVLAMEADGIPRGATRSVLSLKGDLSDWERGRHAPSERYQALLCRIYGRSPVELGFVPVEEPVITPERLEEHDDALALSARYAMAAHLGSADLDRLRLRLDELRQEDRGGAPGFAGEPVAAMLVQLSGLADHALTPSVREGLLSLVADACGIRGWQLLNAGRLSDADATFRLGESAAAEAGDEVAFAFLRGEHAYVRAR